MRMIVRKNLEKKLVKAQLFIFGTSFYLELLAAACIILGIAATFLEVPLHLSELINGGQFLGYLTYMFNIIIGIEILKMFCRHDLDSVVEVLMFAVARQMIIEHTSMLENLMGVLAIAILFATRKYMFVSALDKKNASFGITRDSEEGEAVHPQADEDCLLPK